MAENNHGGRRTGAGRRKIGDVRIAVVVTGKQIRWLDSQCKKQGANRSEYIRFMLDEARGKVKKES